MAMLEHQIRQGEGILRRVHLAIEKGVEALPPNRLVNRHESEAWFEVGKKQPDSGSASSIK